MDQLIYLTFGNLADLLIQCCNELYSYYINEYHSMFYRWQKDEFIVEGLIVQYPNIHAVLFPPEW